MWHWSSLWLTVGGSQQCVVHVTLCLQELYYMPKSTLFFPARTSATRRVMPTTASQLLSRRTPNQTPY